MPLYSFVDERDGTIYEVYQAMDQEHIAFAPDGQPLTRIFTSPHANIDTKWNPDNPHDFVAKSAKKKGTLGNLQDKAKELSLQREERYGVDKVKEKFYADYEKKRGKGVTHPEKRKEKLNKLTKEIKLKINKPV